MDFPLHTVDTAPEGARATLATLSTHYGFVPNLAGAIATSPAVLSALLGLIGHFDAPAMSLTPLERQVVLLAVSACNDCEYCMSAHGMLAHKAGLSLEEVALVQQGGPVHEPGLEALRRFAELVVTTRGRLPAEALSAFEAAGYTAAQVLEVVLGAALKTLTNYVNHIARPPVNAQFAAFGPRALQAGGVRSARSTAGIRD